MKTARRLFRIAIIIWCCLCPMPLLAAETESTEIELTEIEDFIVDLDKEYKGIFSGFSFHDLFENMKAGNFEFDFKALVTGLCRYSLGEMRKFTVTVSELLFLGLIAALLELFHREYSHSRIAETVVALVFMLIAVKTLGTAMDIGAGSIRKAADLLYGVMPVLLGAFVFSGSVIASTVVQPTVLAMLALFTGLVDRFFLPMVLLQGGLTVCSHLNRNLSLKNLSSLVQQLVMLSLGLVMTVFTGVLGLQSFASGIADGLALKTVKIATGNFIPVVGGYLADAFDAILGAGLFLRSSIGIFGAAVIAFVILIPCIKLLIMAISFRLTAGLLEIFGCSHYIAALNDFASVIFTLFAIVVVAGMLFFFFVFCIVAVSSVTVMYR